MNKLFIVMILVLFGYVPQKQVSLSEELTIDTFDSIKEKVINEINTLNIIEVERSVKYCCDWTAQDSLLIISYKLIEKLQNIIKSDNKLLITDFIKFPARVNGKIAYKTQEDLIKDFDNIFPEEFKNKISNADFDCLGCDGIMIGNGEIWFDYMDYGREGKITAINNR